MSFHKIVEIYFTDGLSKKFINKVYGLTTDTIYQNNNNQGNNGGNMNMDTNNNFYYGSFVYPNFYQSLGFDNNQFQYFDQQQLFNPYNYPAPHQRLDFNS